MHQVYFFAVKMHQLYFFAVKMLFVFSYHYTELHQIQSRKAQVSLGLISYHGEP